MIDPFLMPHLLNGAKTTVDAETARDETETAVYLYLNNVMIPTMLDTVNLIDPSAKHIRQIDALVEMWGQLGWFLSSPTGQKQHGCLRETALEVLARLDGKLDD